MISVCMASYNGERYIQEQINSILPQLGALDELIISDDGSTDSTRDLIKDYLSDSRVKLIDGPKRGLIKNFEHVISESKGDYVFLADQDDVWLPDKVSEMMKAFKADPTVLVVVSDLTIVDGELQIIEDSYFSYKGVRVGTLVNILRNTYIGAGMAFRKELKRKILPFPKNIPMHDMWIGISAGGGVALVNKKLTLYRRHDKNNSQVETTSSLLQKIKWRFHLIESLFFKR